MPAGPKRPAAGLALSVKNQRQINDKKLTTINDKRLDNNAGRV
jgi:hypothetical protein